MTLEERVAKLERNYKNLNESFLKSQRNNTNTVSRVDDNSNRVEQLTPYTETKTAYIGDTELIFTNVPSGNLSIFASMVKTDYERLGDKVLVYFKPLEEVTEITISIS